MFRVSTSGELLFGNPASASLLKFWAIDIGDQLPDDIFNKIVGAAQNDRQEDIEVDTLEQVVTLKPVWVPEFSIYNVYGTDVTALKAFTRFPSLNPNPVFRVQRETGNLLFTNPAAERICNGLGLSFSVPLGEGVLQELIDAAEQDSFIEHTIDDTLFELRPVSVKEFDFINVYGTDVTAPITGKSDEQP